MNNRHDDSRSCAKTPDPVNFELPPQVLVVDDSEAIRDAAVLMLHMNGYRAVAAENGLVAQGLLAIMQPILIISDLRMPQCDGWGLLAYCHEYHPDIPVMIMSGDDLGKHPEIERWAAGFVAKPFGFEEFCTAVDQLISRAA